MSPLLSEREVSEEAPLGRKRDENSITISIESQSDDVLAIDEEYKRA